MLRLTLLFIILIVYGSLYPFDQWTRTHAPLFDFMLHWPSKITGADLVQNVLAYAPLGLFLTLHRLRLGTPSRLYVLAGVSAAGLALSVLMESLQQFTPSRTASTADIAMNLLGTAAGALLALGFARTPHVTPRAVRWLHRWRDRRFAAGTLPNIGLAAIALWLLSQTSPLVPVFDLAYLERKLAFLLWQLQHVRGMRVAPVLVAAAQSMAVGMLLRTLMREPPTALPVQQHPAGTATVFAAMLAAVCVARLFVYGRYLALEELAGAAIALCLLIPLWHMPARRAAALGAALLLTGFIVGESVAGFGRQLQSFNWVPLAGQLRSLAGLENILELFWPFFTLAYFVRWLTPPHRRTQVQWLGSLLVLALVFRLEWMQQALPGRFGDITQVLLAVCGWLLPFSFRSGDFRLSNQAMVSAAQLHQASGAVRAGRSSVSRS